MNWKKIVSLSAAGLVCVCACAGCTPKEPTPSSSNTGNNSESEVSTIPEITYEPVDLGGAEIVIKTVWNDSWGGQEPNVSDFYDLMNEWKENTERDYHCTIKVERMNSNDTQNALITGILAGDKVADFIDCQLVDIDKMRMAGDTMLDLNTVSTLNLKDPAWVSGITERTTFNGKTYGICCDFSIQQNGLFYNKRIANEHQLGDLYDLVEQKQWTFEKYAEFSRKATKDLSGDGIMDEFDQYGAAFTDVFIYSMVKAAGSNIVSKNGDTFEYTLYNENTVSMLNKLKKMIHEDNVVLPRAMAEDYNQAFKEGRVLFLPSSLWVGASFADMFDDFGFIPNPLASEGDEYMYTGDSWTRVFAIPSTNKDPEKAGAILSSYIAASKKVKEVRLNEFENRTFREDANATKIAEMLASRVDLDYGLPEIGFMDPWAVMIECTWSMDLEIASTFDSIDEAAKALVDDIYNS